MHLSDLKLKHVTELVDMAIANELEGANHFTAIDPLLNADSAMVTRIAELTQRTAGLPL